jgi:hypothetical protein
MRGIIDLPCSEYVRHEGFLCEPIGPVAAHRLEFRSRPDSRLRAPNAAIAGMKSVHECFDRLAIVPRPRLPGR